MGGPIPQRDFRVLTLKEGDQVRINDDAVPAPETVRGGNWEHNQNRPFSDTAATSSGFGASRRSLQVPAACERAKGDRYSWLFASSSLLKDP